MVQPLIDALAMSNEWAVVALVLGLALIPAITKIVIARNALRGVESRDKAKILHALASLFRWWGRGRP